MVVGWTAVLKGSQLTAVSVAIEQRDESWGAVFGSIGGRGRRGVQAQVFSAGSLVALGVRLSVESMLLGVTF